MFIAINKWIPVYAHSDNLLYPSTNCNTKTYLYNFDPLKPHFYIAKLGFSGVYIIFLSEAVLTSTYNLCFEQKCEKNISYSSENFLFLELIFSIYLHRRVFIMALNHRSCILVYRMILAASRHQKSRSNFADVQTDLEFQSYASKASFAGQGSCNWVNIYSRSL